MYKLIAIILLSAILTASAAVYRKGSDPSSQEAIASNRYGVEKLDWLTIEQASSKLQEQKKPVLIDLYTDWCGWCKVMDKKTYTNEELIRYVEEKFYPVKLDAEAKRDFMWKEKKFSYDFNNKVNQLAIYLTGGRLSFPTTIIIPADGSAPQAIPGYLKASELEIILKYFGEGHYPQKSFQDYAREFKGAWK